jgi:hypothetical protein
MQFGSWIVAFAVPVALAACQDPAACTLNVLPAVEVEVRDRVTNDFLSIAPRGVLREGSFQDSLRVGATTLENPPRVVTLVGADERTGQYVVQIEADGYQPWDTAGVQVTADECHVNTERFTAALNSEP